MNAFTLLCCFSPQDNCPGVVDVRVSVNSNEYQTEQSALIFRKFQPGNMDQEAEVYVAPTRYVHPNRIIEFCFCCLQVEDCVLKR
jgi:hypothetical protein